MEPEETLEAALIWWESLSAEDKSDAIADAFPLSATGDITEEDIYEMYYLDICWRCLFVNIKS